MTDNEIIKALEKAEYKVNGVVTQGFYLSAETYNAIIDLINRQKAEIERLTNHIQEGIDLAKQLSEMVALAQAEAIKEFVSMVKEHSYQSRYGDYIVDVDDIDNVMKEKVGE